MENIPYEFQAIPEEHSTDDSSLYNDERNNPKLFTQSELNDLVGDLNLPKEYAEDFGSRLKEKNLLADGTLFYYYYFYNYYNYHLFCKIKNTNNYFSFTYIFIILFLKKLIYGINIIFLINFHLKKSKYFVL